MEVLVGHTVGGSGAHHRNPHIAVAAAAANIHIADEVEVLVDTHSLLAEEDSHRSFVEVERSSMAGVGTAADAEDHIHHHCYILALDIRTCCGTSAAGTAAAGCGEQSSRHDAERRYGGRESFLATTTTLLR